MCKDENRKHVRLLIKGGNRIMPKGTIMGGYGGGAMSARKADRLKVVPRCLPGGVKTYVQIATGEEGENKTKPKVGTLYSLIKPLEKAAAQKGLETKRAKKILADKRAADEREKGLAKAAPLRAAAEKRKAAAEKRKDAARRGAETRRQKKAAKGDDQ
jgi:hypothetical protein